MIFRRSQKIVCIGTDGTPGIDWNTWIRHWKVILPVRGGIYTVRDTRAEFGRQHIRVVEIRNPLVEYTDAPRQEPWFWSSAFRPLVDRKTDISTFTELLKTKEVENVS